MRTRLIKRSDIQGIFGIVDAIAAVEHAFGLYGEGKAQMPAKVYVHFEKGDLRCMPVFIPEIRYACVKNVTVHPANLELPTVLATITLIDPESGFPLAMLDGAYITQLRTAAASAIAVKYLARANAKKAGFIGCGYQARAQLEAIFEVAPQISQVLVYDRDLQKSREFLQFCRGKFSFDIQVTESAQEVVSGCDILTTLTPSRAFFVDDSVVGAGLHINAIGADAQGKQELDPRILKRARVVVDNWDQASHSGEINVAVSNGLIARTDIAAEIGEIVAGKKDGRLSDQEVTVFDSTGLAIQDLACAASVYEMLKNDRLKFEQLQAVSFLD